MIIGMYKLLPLGIMAILSTLFIQVAHATNESSYEYGYQAGKGEFASCDDFDADCKAINFVTIYKNMYALPRL